MKQRHQSEGGIILGYRIFSWFVLRAYGVAFGYLAWVTQTWVADDHPMLPNLLHGAPENIASGVLWALSVTFTVPFLTPPFIASPKSVWSGMIKAILLGAATFALMIMFDIVLQSHRSDIADAIRANLPLLLKTLGSICVISAILVGFVSQLTEAAARRERPVLAPQTVSNGAWKQEMAKSNGDRANHESLRNLRRNRMPQPAPVPIFEKSRSQ